MADLSQPAIDIVVNVWEEQDFATYPAHLMEFWNRVRLEEGAKVGITIEEMLDRMDQAHVRFGLLISARGGEFEITNRRIAEVVDRYPDRFAGVAGIDPTRGMDQVRELESGVRDFGFVGAHIYPHWFNAPPDDRIYWPFYAKCAELDIPVQIQVGHSAQKTQPTVAKPMTLDTVAIAFPELKIVAIHIGYPWTEEMISIAWKHSNVFIGSDAHAPRYWDPSFVNFINTRGRHKVMFGTDFPVIDFVRARQEIAELDIREESLEPFLYGNARRVYRLWDRLDQQEE